MKEFNDAGSKMNQIGLMSKQHQNAEDEDYMQSVFESYHKEGKDKRGLGLCSDAYRLQRSHDLFSRVIGHPTGNMILNKETTRKRRRQKSGEKKSCMEFLQRYHYEME